MTEQPPLWFFMLLFGSVFLFFIWEFIKELKDRIRKRGDRPSIGLSLDRGDL